MLVFCCNLCTTLVSIFFSANKWLTSWRFRCRGWQWRNFLPYLRQSVFAAILREKLFEMFVTVTSFKYMTCWEVSDHTDTLFSQLIQCSWNNMINLRHLTAHIVSCYTHKMAIALWPQIMWRHFTRRIYLLVYLLADFRRLRFADAAWNVGVTFSTVTHARWVTFDLTLREVYGHFPRISIDERCSPGHAERCHWQRQRRQHCLASWWRRLYDCSYPPFDLSRDDLLPSRGSGCGWLIEMWSYVPPDTK